MTHVWTKPEDGSYYFKKAHAVAYAHAIVVHMNLLCEQLNEESNDIDITQEEFWDNVENLVSKTLKGSKLNVPIWFLRQAGRHLPEYFKIREKETNFIKFCLMASFPHFI